MKNIRLAGFLLGGTVALLAGHLASEPVLAREPSASLSQSSRKLQPQKGNLVLLPDDRLVVGVVEEVKEKEIKVNTGELQPRYLSLKEETENRRRPLIRGDLVEIWVNDQGVVVDYNPLDTLGWHKIIRGTLVQPLAVDQQWAVIKKDKGKEEAYAIRPLARSKVAAMPVGSSTLFLVDKANKIVDATFANDKATIPLSGTWKGSLSSNMKDGYAEIVWMTFQSGPNVSGQFVCTGGTLKCHTVSGAVTGTIDTVLDARMLYTDGHLCGLTGTISGTTIQGEYSCDDKLGEDRGTWRMSWEAPGPPPSP